MMWFWLIILAWLELSTVSEAATLYVNNSGSPACSDATAKASNSAGSPWCTIYRAAKGVAVGGGADNTAEAAAAGDTVKITSGTYSIAGSGSRSVPAYNPANSGTVGSPIRFESLGGTVTLTLSSSNGAIIGAGAGKNYIWWKGFTIDELNAPSHADTGSVVFWQQTGGGIEDSVLDGNGDPGYGDNHVGVRLEESTGITIRNNVIHSYRTSVVNQYNGACIQNYDSDDILIEHNELYDCGSGVFWKIIGRTIASDAADTIRYNYIHDNRWGLIDNHHDHLGSTTIYALFYQNVIVNSDVAGIALIGLSTGPTNGRFVNNTIAGSLQEAVYILGSALLTDQNTLFQNNLIVSTTANAIHSESGAGNFTTDKLALVRNWYYTYGTFVRDFGTNRTFANFQSTYPTQDVDAVNATDPQFVAIGSGAAYYKLQGGSPALTAGRVVHSIGGTNGDTIPVGAYITGLETIGILTASSSTTGAVISGGVRFTGSVRIQ